MTGNLERLVRRKRQARLTFDPVDRGSSPAGSMAPARVRYERPGKVTLRQTPSSSRVEDEEGEEESDDILSSSTKIKNSAGRSPFKLLPTPSKSSQAQPKVPSSAERSNTLEAESDSSLPPRKLQPRISKTFGKPRSSATAIAYEDDTSDGSEPEEPEPQKKTRSTPKSQIVDLVSDSEDEMFAATKRGTPKKATPPKKTPEKKSPDKTKSPWGSASKKYAKATTITDDSEDEIALPALRRGSTPNRRPNIFGSGATQSSDSKRRGKQPVLEESESDSDDIVSSPKRSQPTRRKIGKLARKAKFQAEPEDSDSDSDILPSPLKRQRPIVLSDDSEEEISPLKRRRAAPISEDEDEEELVSPTKRQRNGSGRVQVSSDEEGPVSSIKQRRNARVPTRISSADESVAEPSSPIKRSARQQNTKRHRTEKEKTMELLRRKRAGEKIYKLTSSEEEDSEEESEDELEVLSNFEDDDEEEPEQVRKPKKGSKAKIKDKQGDVEDDSDFIVEDDDGPLGVPEMAIPLQFTHAAHKPLKEHFKDVVEWMIKNKIYPAFPRDDPIYNNAFQKLNDESYGLAKSKFSSTQWTSNFTTALYARPYMESGPLDPGEGFALGVPKCDACNHKSHVPSAYIQFTGKAYDPRTLVELDQGDSEDEDSDDADSDAPKSVDGTDQDIPLEKTRWAVGRFCKANAEQSHTLLHWKFSLNEWVIDTLEQNGYLTPEKLAERDKMKPKQLNRLADNLVDEWEAQGTIKGLYRDYKNQLDEAKKLTSHGRGGWK